MTAEFGFQFVWTRHVSGLGTSVVVRSNGTRSPTSLCFIFQSSLFLLRPDRWCDTRVCWFFFDLVPIFERHTNVSCQSVLTGIDAVVVLPNRSHFPNLYKCLSSTLKQLLIGNCPNFYCGLFVENKLRKGVNVMRGALEQETVCLIPIFSQHNAEAREIF